MTSIPYSNQWTVSSDLTSLTPAVNWQAAMELTKKTKSAFAQTKKVLGIDVPNVTNEMVSPITLRPEYLRIVEDAYSIMEDCSKSGWDGYEANPIEIDSLNNALKFLELLGTNHKPIPTIVPQAQGNVALEWKSGKDTLLATIGSEGTISFGAVYEGKPTYGLADIEDKSGPLFDLLERFKIKESLTMQMGTRAA